MIFAWIFELTPDGLKRDSGVIRNDSITPQTARRMQRSILVLPSIALAYSAFGPFVLAPGRKARRVTSAAEAGGARRSCCGGCQPGQDRSAFDRRVALRELVAEADNAFFASGIQNPILTNPHPLRIQDMAP
ncbi:MAG: hypothetical protein IT479_04800 [Xanthomonadales bacterium]|nr:hypothetical protein [Xanthomonadales bacterium]MCC6592574.1 hypothetical protein [Xanthomonadales bacterium]MCE7932593.1 hypothetical protein [Xanthomonadales bacterium PRO6]